MPDITDTIVPNAEADTTTTAKDSQAGSPDITLTESSATGGTALGQAVWLMLQMPMYRHVFLSDLEWMVLPPILLNQFRLFNAGGKVVAFAAWAYLSEEAEARLQEPNPKLAPTDWKSGDRLWLVNMFAPYGHGESALLPLSKAALISQKFRMHSRNRSGNLIVRQYPED